MFETSFSIDQQELETQQSLPILDSSPSSSNIQLRIDSLENILRFNIQEDESSVNELGSQYGNEDINESIELQKQAQYLKDVVYTTYHPSLIFGKKHYKAYQRLCWNEQIELDSIEELADKQYGENQELRNYILSTLAQIQSRLINQDQEERNPAGDNIDQNQMIQSENYIQLNISLSSESILDTELDKEYHNDIEQKIQNYNSNCNILERFTAQYKSQSQIDNF